MKLYYFYFLGTFKMSDIEVLLRIRNTVEMTLKTWHYKHKKCKVKDTLLTLLAPISQNGQTHSNSSLAICQRIV